MNGVMRSLYDAAKRWMRLDIPIPRSFVGAYLEWSLLRDLLKTYQVNIIFDVGANVGQFARNLRQIGYDGYICSFEPVTSAFADLSANFAHDRKWYGYPYALGSQATQQTFYVAEGATIMSSFLPPVENGWRQCPITVDVKRLDVLCAEVVAKCGLTLPRIFLKMDTQGYDLEVLRGAAGCLSDVVGIQSEVSVRAIYQGMPHYLEALHAYESFGFELFGLSEVHRHAQKRNLIEMNCVMMRPLL